MDAATLLRTAKLIAVPLPFFLGGYSFAFSQNAVPGVLDFPANFSTPVFKHVFQAGGLVVAPGGILSAAASGYLAYALPRQRSLWGMAAVVSVLPLVWTGLVMSPGINRLIAISGDTRMQEKATANLEHRQLLSTWIMQNYVRAASYFVAGVVALRATVGA
ncbi:hypothetical protein LTR02_006179 [Friedmanniomyces endolithicus]|nr:hypothetical protein LTR94_020923 [Friedmanniomyces endolithicus]KAK0773060.1 hypothetical protein LTR38_016701 [Friedmanniomyces endolithicus]KAK0777778.1 hypothetical protein LTR75_015839 [Friedmanniomyces endolithicus]KAK0789249.1 hypothetical protein LTR59_009678 [Friedmanniomyces endolithicus]KAK0830596.1 hypothetical protein LTR03_015867 [Friedmanniomyces endolithicus]